MVLNGDGLRYFPYHCSRFSGRSSRRAHRQAGGYTKAGYRGRQIGNGTRRARALLKRLDAQEHAKNKSRLYSSHPAVNKPCQKERIGTATTSCRSHISRQVPPPISTITPSFHTELAPL
jgi:hypothetical protein